jgi:hypothetical protein
MHLCTDNLAIASTLRSTRAGPTTSIDGKESQLAASPSHTLACVIHCSGIAPRTGLHALHLPPALARQMPPSDLETDLAEIGSSHLPWRRIARYSSPDAHSRDGPHNRSSRFFASEATGESSRTPPWVAPIETSRDSTSHLQQLVARTSKSLPLGIRRLSATCNSVVIASLRLPNQWLER